MCKLIYNTCFNCNRETLASHIDTALPLCNACASKLTLCPECSEIVSMGDLMHSRAINKLVCIDCLETLDYDYINETDFREDF